MSKARGLADLGNVYSDSALSNRNLIINGAMDVAQRGTSVALVNNTAQYLVDRFRTYFSSSAAVTMSQDADGPAGFLDSLKFAIGTGASPSASDQFNLTQVLEGNVINQLALGTANAKQFTISFWVKSSLTGTFGMGLQSAPSTIDSYVASYTISAANTWEYKSVTIAGKTSGTWASGNTGGLYVVWDLGSGTNFETTANTWGTGNKFTVSGATKVVATTGATWQMTGVQLEVGDTATPFEYRSYGDELARCQRYYYKPTDLVSTNRYALWQGRVVSGENYNDTFYLPVPMRSSPTHTAAIGQTSSFDSATINVANLSNQSGRAVATANATDNDGFYYYSITADAEL